MWIAGVELTIESVDEVRHMLRPLLDGFPARWGVAGGWAIDLFLGRMTRPHADIELAIFRQDQRSLRGHFRNWTFAKIVDGRPAVWSETESLELPIHEIHARPVDGSSRRLEFLLNERIDDNWVYRRHFSIRLPIEDAVVQSGGLPVLAPEIVLLFKSKSPREKDEADFASVLSTLDAKRRRWLGRAIASIEPEHPWLKSLETNSD